LPALSARPASQIGAAAAAEAEAEALAEGGLKGAGRPFV